MLALSSQRGIVEALRQRLEVADRPTTGSFSSGCQALDRILPGHAFQRGTLIEYLADSGSGAVVLALIAAREACRDGGALVVIDRSRSFYPPAAANVGIDINTIFVRPQSTKDQLWALNQALHCPGVGAVLSWTEKLNDRAFRTLQLAAESSGTVGFFLRPVGVRGDPTWSGLQLLASALPAIKRTRRIRLEVVRCRNGQAGASVDVELDDETGTLQESDFVPVASKLAAAKGATSSSGA